MIKKKLNKLKEVGLTLFPNKSTREYIKLIKESKLFRKGYYRRTAKLNFFYKFIPIRHYVIIGEKKDLKPFHSFSPEIYRDKYPDVVQKSLTPFKHYLLWGKDKGKNCVLHTGPLTYPEIKPLTTKTDNSIAIVLHIHYIDLWDELASYLKRCDYEYDLYCTISITSVIEQEELLLLIKNFHPQAYCIVLPNHGRDIYPFLFLINHELLDRYDIVIKGHTKKSPHLREGNLWRLQLMSALFPRTGGKRLLEEFKARDDVICAVAPNQILTDKKFWGQNESKVHVLLNRLNIEMHNYPLHFPAGSMFFAKQNIIQALKSLNLTHEDFEYEENQLDNTTAHAIERVIGFIAQSCHKPVVEISELRPLKNHIKMIF